jgi:hypothetical protein
MPSILEKTIMKTLQTIVQTWSFLHDQTILTTFTENNARVLPYLAPNAITLSRSYYVVTRVMHWCSFLRHCTTSWKVAGLISDAGIGLFILT